jgi:hypothetical protein
MEKIKQKRGVKPINDVPMSAAERKQRQRDKLKFSGGKQFTITISGELMEWVNALVEASEGEKTEGDILRDITENSIKHRVSIYLGAMHIKNAGGSIEDMKRFYEDNREKITNINEYLPKDAIS